MGECVGASVEGYEIHMGETTLAPDAHALIQLDHGSADGCARGNVYGSYLHGFFDSSACREAILGALAAKKGVSLEAPAFDFAAYRETQYDLLASSVREHLDMKLIYRILEEGI